MRNDIGIKKLSESPEKTDKSLWQRAADWISEEVFHSLGRPARLKRTIASGQLTPYPVIAPADTFWLRSVVGWQDWMSLSVSAFHSRPWTLHYRSPGYLHRLESFPLGVPEVQQLIRKEYIPLFSCDITDIRGISVSKSMEHDIRDIDEFPIIRCREMAEPVTEEHLKKNMRHRELRLDNMLFAEYPWAERRLYWLNDGGSHHFGAARYQARRLGIAVPLTGTLCRYSVNVQMISALRNKWHLMVIPKDELFGCFFDAMEAFKCAFGCSDLPPRMHDKDKSGVALKLIWLDRGNPRANAVAAVLTRAGFPDFGKQLAQLATQTVKTSRLYCRHGTSHHYSE